MRYKKYRLIIIITTLVVAIGYYMYSNFQRKDDIWSEIDKEIKNTRSNLSTDSDAYVIKSDIKKGVDVKIEIANLKKSISDISMGSEFTLQYKEKIDSLFINSSLNELADPCSNFYGELFKLKDIYLNSEIEPKIINDSLQKHLLKVEQKIVKCLYEQIEYP